MNSQLPLVDLLTLMNAPHVRTLAKRYMLRTDAVSRERLVSMLLVKSKQRDVLGRPIGVKMKSE
jgi:hypothetical protein